MYVERNSYRSVGKEIREAYIETDVWEVGMKQYKDIEFTLHAIITGVLFNGYFQGKTGVSKLDGSVIKEALKEIKKLMSGK